MKLPLSSIKKIGIFRALQLGDLLCCIPAVRALRTAYPQAEITLISLPWAESLLSRFPHYFDRFIHFPGYPGLPEQPYNDELFEAFKQQMKAENFDLLLQMQGNGTIVNEILQHMNARFFSGFCLDDCNADALLLSYPSDVHEIIRHIMLMENIGIPSRGTQLEFPLFKKDEDDLNRLQIYLQPKKYVCIHPGSRGNWRQWPTEYFALLGDYFAGEKFTVVLTGTSEEKNVTASVASQMKHDVINLAGKTNIGAVGVLIKNAFMLIANCTGVSHIASALKTSSVIISMDGEPNRWAPLDTSLHKTTDWTINKNFSAVLENAQRLQHELLSGNKIEQLS